MFQCLVDGRACMQVFGFRSVFNFKLVKHMLPVLLLGLYSGTAVAGAPPPAWEVPRHLTSNDGHASLEWSLPAGREAAFFKVTETFQGMISISYTEATTLSTWRLEPGDYRFVLRACVKNDKGRPDCGAPSKRLTLRVTPAVTATLLTGASAEPTLAAVAPGTLAIAGAGISGGPDQLRPGQWYNPAKSGHGWSFYWSNRLALPKNDPLFGSSYDLLGIWYTYEAKLAIPNLGCSTCPPKTSAYRPVAIRFKAVLTGPNRYGGGLYKSRDDGSEVWIGNAEITFGSNSSSATISWSANFRKESLSDTDPLQLLLGSDAADTSNISHFSGLWQRNGDNRYYVVTDIGDIAEVVTVVFYDDAGEPTWLQDVVGGAAVSGSTDFCLAWQSAGYAPDTGIPPGWSTDWYMSGCDSALPASSSNRNGRRYFSGLSKEYIWADFTLPGTNFASGSISIGTSSTPLALEKRASFHGVSYESATGTSCEITSAAGTCEVQLTWYTDGHYPAATVYARNYSNNTYYKVGTSTQPEMPGIAYQVSVAGTYAFELHMGSSPSSTLIARSPYYKVTSNTSNTPPSLTQPADQAGNTGDSVDLQLKATDADAGDVLAFSASGLPTGLSIAAATGRIRGTLSAPGEHSVAVTVADGRGGTASRTFKWSVLSAQGNPETPPLPAAMPAMVASSSSSRVGATPGEFRVDESGTATYTIPILDAPSSGGISPKITLNYSSQGGNGDIGVGWSLGGVSAITLCPQTIEQDDISTPRGIRLDGNDRFCLDGQRLVVESANAEYGKSGTRYRTEIDSFARITSYGSAGNGPAWFKVERKDGSVAQYGKSTDSRIEARGSANPATVFVWAQNRFQDRSGNYMLYRYLENTSGPVGYVLRYINYTGNTRARTPVSARLIFTYADRGSAADLGYRYFAGVELEQRRLLQSIRSQGRLRAGTAFKDLRYYSLGYAEDGTGRKILTSLTECSSSNRSVCYKPTRFDWLKSESTIDASATVLKGLLPKTTLAGLLLADVSGDGRPDLLYTRLRGDRYFLYVKEATASGKFIEWPANYRLPKKSDGSPPRVLAIDINGDGFQDVVYGKYSKPTDDYTWVALVSTGKSFSAETEPNAAHRFDLDAPELESRIRVMDFNGDGRSDILHAEANNTDKTWQLNVLLNAGTDNGKPVFSSPIKVDIDNSDLFPGTLSGGWRLSSLPPLYDWAAGDADKTEIPDARIFDFNGDGAVDLLIKVWRSYKKCVSNCNLPAAVTNAAGGNSGKDGTTTDPVYEVRFASFWVLMASDGNNAFSRHSIVALGENCDALEVCDAPQYANLPRSQSVWPVDINADGLSDLAWGDTRDNWYFQINTGNGYKPAQLIGPVPPDLNKLVRFEDWSGDGYPDLIYPSAILEDNAKWMLYQNHFGRAFAAPSNTGVPTGNVGGDSDVDPVHNDSSIFSDFTGDGKTDLLSIDNSKMGEILSVRIRKGMNVSGSRVVAPANVITAITNGQGMRTTITYKPLTDSGVYTRMRDSANASWGNGSVVYDYIAPVYVVSEVRGSAPVYNNTAATNRIQYHYAGAKIQAGGRGFLGYGEVVTYDPQSQIRTNTRYRQDFPFIGMPIDTTQVSQAGGSRFALVSDIGASVPGDPQKVSASTQFPRPVSGTRLSYALNEWRFKSTTGDAKFPYVSDSIEVAYTFEGGFNRKLLTSNSYDAYGNLLRSRVSTYADDSLAVFASKTILNTYADNVSTWLLGRLATSKVTHARAGKASISRNTRFSYDAASGELKQEVIEPGSSTLRVTTDYKLDHFGNRTKTSVTGVNMATRKTTVRYDNLGRFVIQSTNALKQITQKVNSWDVFGNPLSVENIDGVVTTAVMDHMGRPFATYTETGAWSKTTHSTGTGGICPQGTVARSTTQSAGAPTQTQCFDIQGRATRSAVTSLAGSYIYTDKFYDSSGRVERVSEPYFAGETRHWNLTGYDKTGRVTTVLSASGDDVIQRYDGNSSNACTAAAARVTLIINGLGQRRVEVTNALGETEAVYDAVCGKVSYTYDATGNLTKVTGADGEVVTMSYDLAGRKTSMKDPDKGYWRYAYNALGEMTRQLDNRKQALDFTYDVLGRVIDRRELKGVSSLTDAAFTTLNRETSTFRTASPGKGQLASVSYRNGELGAVLHKKAFTYDSFGRVDVTSTTIGTEQFAEQTTYDQYSRVFQQFDASGDDRGLRYVYSGGYLSKLKEAREGRSGVVYQDIREMDARGNVTVMQLGNGVDAYASYAADSGRLLKLSAFDASGAEIMDVDYLFDVLGNLKKRHDVSPGANLKETFSYDPLNRLKSVRLSVNAAASSQTLSLNYDAAGNISYKSDVGNYLYNGSQPHAVSRAGGVSYSYDANGNQISGDGRTITYTVFDKPAKITRGTNRVDFSYGIGHSRYQRQDRVSGVLQKNTLYLGAVERITENGSTFFKRYLAGVAIATYYPVSGAQQLSYLLKDHIGSIHSVLDKSGLITATMRFSAFGERQATDWRTPLNSFMYAALNDVTTRGFTGHEQVDSVGIVHMNGRIYDARLGRFLQADPVVQAPKNSQSLNRYSYVLNNPLSYTDPTGYFSLGKFFKKYGRVIAAAVVTYFTAGIASGWAAGWGFAAGSAGNAAIAGTIAGAAGGAILTGTVKGAFFGALTGAALGAIGATGWSDASKTVAGGTAGGVSSELQGGKFGHGFLSAGAGFWTSLKFGGPPSFGKFLAAATAGGTLSELTGGKFANGAISAGLAYVMAAGKQSYGEEGEWIYPEGKSTYMNDYDAVMTNGILGKREDILLAVQERQIPAYFNHSHRFFADVWESFNQKIFGSTDALARGFARGLANVDHPMVIIAKSQGTLTVTNAARFYGLPSGSSFILNSPALTRYSANVAVGINGGTLRYVQPWGDGANIWAPSLNPLRFFSGLKDLTCGFCVHSANGLR